MRSALLLTAALAAACPAASPRSRPCPTAASSTTSTRSGNGRGPNPYDEIPGLPGYTALGDVAANHAVLGPHGYRADGRNPWEPAPLHLAQMLAPALAYTGYATAGARGSWDAIPGGRPRP